MSNLNQVMEAASLLVAAFAANDTDAYFAAFSEDASFIFHTCEQVLENRAAYRALWDSWQAEGFRVLECQSLNAQAQLINENAAIFYHEVRTRVLAGGQNISSIERETIIFRREDDGRWLACHEHLAAAPTT